MVAAEEIRPFRIAVPDDAILDLRERLTRTRWPDQLAGTGWSQGAPLPFVRDLCEYWCHEFDWREVEETLNRWPQFRTVIDGQQVHFLHVRSAYPDAVPLLLTHGWPGSVWEFVDVLRPLVDPVAFGGEASDAFHVVCPSLPGFGWSGPTAERGWGIQRIGRLEAELMARLGYDKFGAQGGDWGAVAAAHLAVQNPERLIGIHLNLVMVPPPSGPPIVDDEGRAEIARRAHLDRHERGYSAIQSTKPLTLAYGLTDSPAALAAWIGEKFHSWTDAAGAESALSKDTMIRNIATYWFTGTAASSVRLYYESNAAGQQLLPTQYVSVPTGCAIYPAELWRPPRTWVERAYNVVHWVEQPRGGHFAAMEQPDLFVPDVRVFFRALR